MKADYLAVVYPSAGSVRYQELARRLVEALEESTFMVKLFSGEELCAAGGPAEDAAVALVGPAQLHSSVYTRLTAARARIAVVSEPAESERYAEHLGLAISFDAVLDVGFVSQAGLHPRADIPYRFVFDGPTPREQRVLAAASPSQRPLPWALLGTQTAERVSLVAQLLDGLDPGGLVYSPSRRLPLLAEEILSPASLSGILSKTKYYVWNSNEPYRYCESYQYARALLCGAVPCKVGGVLPSGPHRVPGVFGTAEELCRSLRDGKLWSRYEEAREFHLSGGSLHESLEEALKELV